MKATTKDRVARLVTAAHRGVYRLSRGRVAGRVAGMPVLLLTTRGRATARPRTVPLTYFSDGDDIVVVASYGGDDRHPGWYRNLCADARVEITQGQTRRPMTARPATAEEHRRLWPRIVAAYPGYSRYQSRTVRRIPLVILSPPSGGPPRRGG